MQLPHDIHQRLERRWLARFAQGIRHRQQKNILNEAEVTAEKVEPVSRNAFMEITHEERPKRASSENGN